MQCTLATSARKGWCAPLILFLEWPPNTCVHNNESEHLSWPASALSQYSIHYTLQWRRSGEMTNSIYNLSHTAWTSNGIYQALLLETRFRGLRHCARLDSFRAPPFSYAMLILASTSSKISQLSHMFSLVFLQQRAHDRKVWKTRMLYHGGL